MQAILIVDDDTAIGDLEQEVLERAGYAVQRAYSGKEYALSKRYRGFAALDGLNMHIPKSAIYGFAGRNGAGKTTLIRLICGLQAPSGGSYTLYGVKNTDAGIRRCRRRMGAVVETPSVYLDMTAEENIRQQYRVLGVPSAAVETARGSTGLGLSITKLLTEKMGGCICIRFPEQTSPIPT